MSGSVELSRGHVEPEDTHPEDDYRGPDLSDWPGPRVLMPMELATTLSAFGAERWPEDGAIEYRPIGRHVPRLPVRVTGLRLRRYEGTSDAPIAHALLPEADGRLIGITGPRAQRLARALVARYGLARLRGDIDTLPTEDQIDLTTIEVEAAAEVRPC